MTDDTQERGLIENLKWSKDNAFGATLTDNEVVALLALIERQTAEIARLREACHPS